MNPHHAIPHDLNPYDPNPRHDDVTADPDETCAETGVTLADAELRLCGRCP
ncbi:hypothetical protein [Streptacidiphilus melanogenes]|uniref:hypothetical protein n=1 Tax=Streptacidiphilus melanogenes TaxID=411235 RepID=UPI000A4A0DCE|nr:hypothetical protein [Streptacidiphilus melanogenes]